MKPFLSFICLVCCFATWGQIWSPLQRGVNREVRIIYADTVTNSLYVGGSFSKTGYFSDANGKWVMGIAQWHGAQWDSLSCGMNLNANCVLPTNPAMFPDPVLAMTRYNNELYVGGSFIYAGSTPAWGIAKWNGSSWSSIGDAQSETASYASVMGFLADGSDLYAVGNFATIGGVYSPKIAKYNGTNWVALPVLDAVGGGWAIASVVRYHGKLYVGGNFDGGNGMKDIACYNGITWESVGGGLSGSLTNVNKLYVWHDTLYVGGYFQKTDGSPGNNIAAWDGSNWSDVGGGTMPSNVADMVNFQGYLYVCGQIDSAGAIPVTRMARWDGKRWCNPAADFRLNGGSSGTPSCLAVLNNELYAGGGFDLINGDSTKNIAKYSGVSITNSCDSSTGISELVKQNAISVYPSPATDIIIIEFNLVGIKEASLEIKDVLGQTLKRIEESELDYNKNKIDIDISNFSNGIYFIKISSAKQQECIKIIKE